MKVTVVPEDKFIRKDDIFENLDEWNFDDHHIHAIQWDNNKGEIEFKGPPLRNEVFEDFSILQPYLDALDKHLIKS